MFKMSSGDLTSFEKRICDLFEEGVLPYQMHMSGGNEEQLIEIFKDIEEGDYVLSTHRAHYHYLLKSGDSMKLEEKLRAGKSMFIFDSTVNFLSTSVVSGMASIAAGIAFGLKQQGSKNQVWCFLGDGAEDEGHFYEAVRFVDGWKLPCVFVIEDNDRSVAVTQAQRWGSNKMQWPDCILRYSYESTYPHVGTGTGKIIDFSKYAKKA